MVIALIILSPWGFGDREARLSSVKEKLNNTELDLSSAPVGRGPWDLRTVIDSLFKQ